MGGGWVDGWSDKTKLILISILVEVVVEVEVELGNIARINLSYNCPKYTYIVSLGMILE